MRLKYLIYQLLTLINKDIFMPILQEHSAVVLLKELTTTHFVSGKQIVLPRGCGGTVVDDHIGEFALVEFADLNGKAFAIESISTQDLMLLVHEPLELAL
jgi:hypothetical protein